LIKDLRLKIQRAIIPNLQSLIVLEGRCVSIGQPISYWPFIDILRTYFNLKEDDDLSTIAQKVTDGTKHIFLNTSDETLPFIGRLLSVRFSNELDDRLKFATPEQIRHQTLMQLRDFFRELANKQPLLLILEDLHWSDELSLDLVTYLMDELTHAPLMLLCVYRPEKEQKVWKLSEQAQRKCLDRYTEITLKRLSSHEGRLLVEELLTIDDLPDSVKNTILEKSEGNPFFIEEVIRSLIEQDMVYRDADRWRARSEIVNINVPDTIQSVLLSRVDRLQSEARYVLQCASVIGRLFKYRLLDHLTQHERELEKYLSEFEDRELVYEERRIPELEYAFKHALTQEATYQSILERKRKEFHHQIAIGIERLYQERIEEYYEELAHHYSMSDNTEKTVEYLLKAGDKAKVNYLNGTAISHFKRVLDILDGQKIEQNEQRLEALHGLGEVYLGMGKIAEALDVFLKAIEIAKVINLEAHQLARLYFGLCDSLFWQGRYEDMLRYGETGLEILGNDTECLEAALMDHIISVGNIFKWNWEKGGEYIRRCMSFISKLDYSPELHAPYTMITLILRYARDIEAIRWGQELEMRAREHNDLRGIADAWIALKDVFIDKGDYKEGLSLAQKSLEMFDALEIISTQAGLVDANLLSRVYQAYYWI
jgi:tetratricopeptide (TPR) repeat protein